MFDLIFGNKAVLVPAIIVIAVLIICILGYIKFARVLRFHFIRAIPEHLYTIPYL